MFKFIKNITCQCGYKTIINFLNQIIMNQKELSEKLSAIGAQLEKAVLEIKTAIENAGATTPETDAALKKVSDVAQTLDDLNPDVA